MRYHYKKPKLYSSMYGQIYMCDHPVYNYPTVTIRQIMWALKMKPIKRERWETVFDRRDV